MEQEFSRDELVACALSRDFKDGERAGAGANLLVPRAALLLAHLHHGPNMRIMLVGGGWTNLFHMPVIQVYGTADHRPYYSSEYIRRHEEGFDRIETKKGCVDIFFFGGLQIDRYGNLNLYGIGKDYKRLKVRGPGPIGLGKAATCVPRMYIYFTEHSKRRFAEHLDFMSVVGHGDGPDFRRKWKLPGGGPRWVATPLAIMDFEEETKRMRLKSVHPGVTVKDVIENTGFELIIPKEVPTTDPPTKEELDILRNRVDPAGLLRQ